MEFEPTEIPDVVLIRPKQRLSAAVTPVVSGQSPRSETAARPEHQGTPSNPAVGVEQRFTESPLLILSDEVGMNGERELTSEKEFALYLRFLNYEKTLPQCPSVDQLLRIGDFVIRTQKSDTSNSWHAASVAPIPAASTKHHPRIPLDVSDCGILRS